MVGVFLWIFRSHGVDPLFPIGQDFELTIVDLPQIGQQALSTTILFEDVCFPLGYGVV